MTCLQCELPNLFEASRPPDPKFVDLIEVAFLEEQTDGQRADLAYSDRLQKAGDGYCMNIQ